MQNIIENGIIDLMNTVNLVIWIFIYGFCLTHITLFSVIYVKYKNKIELYYLIVLINIFLLAVIIMLSLVFNIQNIIPVIVNGILSLYITIPLWGYNLFGVDRKYFKFIPILVTAEVVIENILLANNLFIILFISRIVFYCLLTIPIFIKKESKYGKNTLERKMQTVTKITVTFFIVFMALLIPFSPMIFEISYISSIFWAVFTLSYQIPGMFYCLSLFIKKDIKFDRAGISALTKRENEVAMAICNGKKYAQIAEEMFITLSAVKNHASSIYRKLGIKNSRELLHIFIEAQRITLPNEPKT